METGLAEVAFLDHSNGDVDHPVSIFIICKNEF